MHIFYSTSATYHYRTKWIRIMRGPGVYEFAINKQTNKQTNKLGNLKNFNSWMIKLTQTLILTICQVPSGNCSAFGSSYLYVSLSWEKILNTKSNPQPPRAQHGYINVRIDLQVSRFSLNKKISIPCTVNSYSTPNVSWKFNGRLVRSGPRIQVNTLFLWILSALE